MTVRSRVGKLLSSALPPSVFVRRGRADRGGVALTFDDGPDAHTLEYLELLDRLDVRATFFLVGELCDRRPDLVNAVVARGHEVASHGYTHTRFPKLGHAALRDELARSQRALPPPERGLAMVRPPSGGLSPRSVLLCAAQGFQTVMWSLDSDDCRTTSPEVVAQRCAQATSGEIVLLHEGQSWTLEALPAIVRDLRARGLEPMTVSELL